MTNNSTDELKREMEKLGAREYEIVALSMDPVRGLAALAYAQQRGANNPITYATKMFDSADWHPSGETRRVATNLSVERTCAHCGGDRFVIVTDGPGLYDETYAPCAQCNAKADTRRWVHNERRETAPR